MYEDLVERLRDMASSSYMSIDGFKLLNEAADVIESIGTKKRKPKRIEPPTLEEVMDYVRQRGCDVDPKKFYDYFSEGGWIDSEGKPVRNWKQKIITWEGGRNNGRKQHPANAEDRSKADNGHKFVYDNAETVV